MFKQERIVKKKILCYMNKIFKSPSSLSAIFIITILLLLNSATPAEAIPGYKKKAVIFGIDPAIPPYEFIDKDGSPSGFSVEIAKAIADEMGWDAVIKPVEWNDISQNLESGQIDVILSAAYTDRDSKIYEYSLPYHEFRNSFFINTSDYDYFREYGIEGFNPVAHKGSFAYEYMKKNIHGKEIKETGRLIEVISHISEHKRSYTLLNKYLGLYLIKKYGIKNVTPAGDPLLVERYHFACLKKNHELISGLNEGLNILKINGRYKQIYDKWFGIIENEESSYPLVKIVMSIVIPLILIYLVMLIWSWSLDKKIKIESAKFSEELNRHKFSMQALKESEENSRFIIENVPMGLFHFNKNGEITTCNESFIKIAGSSREKLVGLNLLELTDKNMVSSIKSALEGKAGNYEGIYNSTTASKTTFIRAMFTPVKQADGAITGGIGIIEDNTSRKKYEEELVFAKNTAESASSIKSDFLANMSHEVRTPLNGILGMLQLIQTTGVNDEQANYVNIAIKSGMRLTRLLNDILDLSRIESDKLVLAETQFSLKDILDFIKERYTLECEEKNINLSLDIDKEIPDEIVGDEVRIRQILVNLVSNAVKFTKTGSIIVEISAEEVSCDGAVNIIITVKDTGIGIADNMLNHIFEPFRQGENTYKRAFQGAGLGLTLVKHLVNLMNGTIKIESVPDNGTHIECSITVKLPENHSIDIKPLQSGKLNKSGNICTVLIAEDERINRMALKRILEKSGYRILEAENGVAALKILETENPDCILMDIQMPEMDGIEASKQIRDRARFGNKSQIPIIALTAYTMPEDREKITAAGLDDYISKPVNMDYLIKSITKFTMNE